MLSCIDCKFWAHDTVLVHVGSRRVSSACKRSGGPSVPGLTGVVPRTYSEWTLCRAGEAHQSQQRLEQMRLSVQRQNAKLNAEFPDEPDRWSEYQHGRE